jgi:protein phosphatase
MKIQIRQPLCYAHIGEKDNQEDRFYPPTAEAKNYFFILCDGMGGHEKGEVAAETVSEVMGAFFDNHPLEDGVLTDDVFKEGLAAAYDALDTKDTGAFRKMGTTLAFICLHARGCLAAHIGDSRIYQVRPGKGIVYQSSDHTVVNELLKVGELTPEEALNYPQKNVLSRVMQPCLDPRTRADIRHLEDIQPGDYFFLCSDGVLEQLTIEKLLQTLSNADLSGPEKLEALEAVSKDVTRDNYTAWLIPIDTAEPEKEDTDWQENDDVIVATLVEPESKSIFRSLVNKLKGK